jgi:Na+/H+ antiporter NhaD/arsenite permease-like protein
MAAGVDRALANAGAADGRVGEVQQRVTAAGFVGITVGLGRVREAVGQVRAGLAAHAAVIGEAVTGVAAAPREMTPQQAIAVLSPAVEKVATVRTGIPALIDAVDEAQRLTVAVLQGGDPGSVLSVLGAVKQVLVMVVQRGEAAGRHLATAMAEAQRAG